MSAYNIETDTTFEREKLVNMISYGDRSWRLERPLYSIRHDAYFLVRRNKHGYRFTGPIELSAELIDMLPTMTEPERRAALRHLPEGYMDVYAEDVEFINAEEPDGA